MTRETVLTNARLVLEDEVRLGSVVIRDGVIAEIGEPTAAGEDLGGDHLLPGVVELHTDHLEYHVSPRPGVRWDPLGAVLASDAQLTAAGATTVLDAVRIGSGPEGDDGTTAVARGLADAIEAAVGGDLLRADHAIHVRCEVSSMDCVDAFAAFVDDPHVRLASLMDHTPGQRQYADVEDYKAFYLSRRRVAGDDLDAYIERLRDRSEQYADAHRQQVSDAARGRGIALAAHDDATEAHVAQSVGLGVVIAEFPTTVVAAKAATDAGLHVVMGAPNLIRGGSQTGNVAAADLLRAGLLDVLSSDYVPSSPLQAVFRADAEGLLPLVEGVRLVSTNPARAVGLDDRGAIAPGLRADLVRVRPWTSGGRSVPVVREVLREGRRVA